MKWAGTNKDELQRPNERSGNTHMKLRRAEDVLYPTTPFGHPATWQRGGGDKACVTDKQPYHSGTPWDRDIPALVCPLRPLSMNQIQAWMGALRRTWMLKLILSEGHTGGKEGRKGGNVQYQEESILLRHLVYVLGIPLWWGGGGVPLPLIMLWKVMW